MSLKKERRNRKKVKKSEHRWRTCKVKQRRKKLKGVKNKKNMYKSIEQKFFYRKGQKEVKSAIEQAQKKKGKKETQKVKRI